MRTFKLLFLLVGVVFLQGGLVAEPAATTTLADLQARMNAHVNEPLFAQAQWGVRVVSMATGKIIFDHNGDKLMKPASNAKMYTCALALDKLGPDFHIKTSLYAAAKPDADGVIHGDVIVYGRGDPSFASRFNNGDYGLSLKPMLDAIHAAGLKRIDGDLVGDDSYFHGAPYGSEWTWDDLQFYYGAPASALTVEDNCLDLVFKPGARAGDPCEILTKPKTSYVVFDNRSETGATNAKPGIELYKPLGEDKVVVWGGVPLGSRGADDSVAVSHPALWFVSLLKDALAKDGVTVTGNLRSIGWLEREKTPLDVSNLVEVASVSSRPLSEIVKNTLKPSQNQYAQLLLLQVGANSSSGRNRRSHSTEDDGLTEMRRFLTSAGIKRGMALLEEGSGLSRGALVTPSASVQLLTYMAHHRCASVFTNGLPIAGVDGTLRNRFKGTAAAGNLRAKTGSLGHVDTVSGYMTTKGGDPLVLSVMLNNYSAPGRRGDGRVEIDALIKMLADFDGKLN